MSAGPARIDAGVRQAEEEAEQIRRRRIREDAARPMRVNLEATIDLSRALSRIAGIARRK